MYVVDGALQIGQSSEWLTILSALWVKSIIILATAAFLSRILRAASARLRHVLWCVAVSSLLVLPLFSGDLHIVRVPVLPASLFSNDLATPRPLLENALETPTTFTPDPAFQSEQTALVPLAESQHFGPSFSWQSIILSVWLVGVLLVLARFLIGIVIVRRLVVRATQLTGSWSELASELSQKIRLKRPVRLLLSDKGVMPMTCGGLSATVLLPADAEQWSDDRRRVVLLHELIHVKRRDILTQAIAQIVCALYWFNPLAWWAVRKIRISQEWACDESVVATGVAAPDYAGHLLEIARRFNANALTTVTTTGMASSSQLQDRLCAILSPVYQHSWSGRTIAVVAAMGVVLISTAVVQLVPAQRQDATFISSVANGEIQVEQVEVGGQVRPPSMMVADTRVAPIGVDHTLLQQTPSATPTPLDQPTSERARSEVVADNQTKEQQPFTDFSAEEWERLASHGIGPAYIQEMASAGYSGLTVDQLIQLFSNSVRADYVAGLRSVGYDNVSIRDLLSLKTNGITPAVIKSYQAVKHAGIEAKRYVALVSNGVTPSYWKSLADTGYDSLSANKAIAMWRAGITAEFIGEVRSRGYVNLSPNDLIELKRSEKY